MIDSLGKLFECLILNRLQIQIDELGGLSNNQYGFRKGKMESKTTKEFCTIITLDVKNAFNTAKWKVVINAINQKGINDFLFTIIAE